MSGDLRKLVSSPAKIDYSQEANNATAAPIVSSVKNIVAREIKAGPRAVPADNGGGAMQAAGPGANLSAGALVAAFGSKLIVPTMILRKLDHSNQNPVVQFTIDNTGVGNAQQLLRVGSVVGLAGSAVLHNIALGAADNAVITDDYGAGCRKVQGFSQLVNAGAVMVETIKISTSSLTQKDRLFTHNRINYDDTIFPTSNNVGFTAEKSDQLTTLAVAHGNWMLDFNQYFEFTILAAVSLTLYFELKGVQNVDGFTTIGA